MKIQLLAAGLLCFLGSRNFGQTQAESLYNTQCTGPDGNINSCGHSTSLLYCYEGRCKCPDSHLMTSANLPINLHAKWSSDANKCLAINGATCGAIEPNGYIMECQPGMKCKIPADAKVGACGGTIIQLSILSILISVCAVFKSI